MSNHISRLTKFLVPKSYSSPEQAGPDVRRALFRIVQNGPTPDDVLRVSSRLSFWTMTGLDSIIESPRDAKEALAYFWLYLLMCRSIPIVASSAMNHSGAMLCGTLALATVCKDLDKQGMNNVIADVQAIAVPQGNPILEEQARDIVREVLEYGRASIPAPTTYSYDQDNKVLFVSYLVYARSLGVLYSIYKNKKSVHKRLIKLDS